MNESDLTQAVPRIRNARATQAYTLAAWSVGSIVIGGAAWWLARESVNGSPFWRSLGAQFVIWGAIDLVFALLGVRQTLSVKNEPASNEEIVGRDKLVGSLKFNQWLNGLWLALGVALGVWAVAADSASLYGHSVGVLIQGGFLTVLDTIFLRRFRAQQRHERSTATSRAS